MSSDSNLENDNDNSDKYSPSLNSGVFGSYPTISQNEENNQSSNTYLPSLNSGIFGSYYTNPQSEYLPSLNSGVFGSYVYTPLSDTYRLVGDNSEEQEILDPVEEVKEDPDDEKNTKEQNRKHSNSIVVQDNETKEETKEEETKERYNRPVPHYELPPAKSIATEYKQVYKQYTTVQFDETTPIKSLDNDIKPVFDGFKKYARQTGNAFVKVEKNTDFNKSGITNTIGLDIDVKTFNKNKFIRQYCELYGLHESQVNIVGVKAGSVVVEVYISNNGKHEVDLNKLGDRLNDPKVQEKVKEMKAFCILFDKPTFDKVINVAKTTVTKYENRRAYFNSAYDRIYGPGHITWDGDLQDGKNRGGRPYYCPTGWYKRAVTYKLFSSIDFDKKFKGWPIAYHGTSFKFGMSMLLSGFLPADVTAWGGGVYVSPSIKYAAHPRYAKPKKIPANAKEGLKSFGEGDWIQFAFQVRVNPNSKVLYDQPETLCVGNKDVIDPNFKNSEVEWLLETNVVQDPTDPNCGIYIVGLMIRITKDHPSKLPEGKWWFHCGDPTSWDE